eukprot:1162032-Pelagomonas_calceolata.AAC.5
MERVRFKDTASVRRGDAACQFYCCTVARHALFVCVRAEKDVRVRDTAGVLSSEKACECW